MPQQFCSYNACTHTMHTHKYTNDNTELTVAGGKNGEKIYTLLDLKWITAGPTGIAQGTLSVMWQPDGSAVWRSWIDVYIWLNPFAIYLKPSEHC